MNARARECSPFQTSVQGWPTAGGKKILNVDGGGKKKNLERTRPPYRSKAKIVVDGRSLESGSKGTRRGRHKEKISAEGGEM